MFRIGSKFLQRGFASGAAFRSAPAGSSFVKRAAGLKKKFRGKGLYAFARDEAQRFLDEEVPKANVAGWMEDGTNAIALSQVLRFFEIQSDASLTSLMLNRLIRFAEDPAAPPSLRLEATLALISTRPDENYERAFATVEGVLKALTPVGSIGLAGSSGPSSEVHAFWSALDLSAKVLQRCGKRVPPTLNDRLAQLVMAQLQATPPEEACYLQTSLLRIYAWMVRAELPQCTGLLLVLVEHTGDFKSYDFATLMRSCARHHQATPLPVALVTKLAQAGLLYASTCNGGDAAAVLGGIARILSSMEPGVNDVQLRDVRSLTDSFNALLEDFQARCLRFMNPNDPLYWQGMEDVTTIAFAYELGGRVRYSGVFANFQQYVRREVRQLEPQQLAMATGMLRRSQLLTPEMAGLLAERIEVILGELRLTELSHICATFATLPTPPRWMPEAMEVAMRLMQAAESPGHVNAATRFNLSVAFPAETFAQPIDYSQMSGRQLVDALALAVGKPVFEGALVNALVAKLEDVAFTGRFATDDVLVLLSAPNPAVVQAVQQYLIRCLEEPEWPTDVLFTLPIAMQSPALYPLASNPSKALASAKAAAISPELFVALLELLVGIWKDSDPGINEFAVVGGMDLVQAPRLLGSTLIRYLRCVLPFPPLHPRADWLSELSRTSRGLCRSLRPEELVGLLAALHGLFTSVQATPALQPLLGEVMEGCYEHLKEADADAARATVLLAHLQQGMAVPLITTATSMAQRVLASAATYPDDLRDALQRLPLPQGTASLFGSGGAAAGGRGGGGERRGRFTMKSTSSPGSGFHRSDPMEPSALPPAGNDPLDFTDGDPFGSGTMDLDPQQQQQQQAEPEQPVEETPEPQENAASASSSSGNEAPSEAPEASAAAPERSYYSKFFNSSLGLLFRGDQQENNSQQQQQQPQQQQQQQQHQTGSEEEAHADNHRPRRTVLRPYAPSAPPQQQQQQHQSAHTPPSSSWGSAPSGPWGVTRPTPLQQTFGQPPQPPQQQQQQQQPPQRHSSVYNVPSAAQNAEFFSNLFQSSPTQQQHQQQTSYGAYGGYGTAPPPFSSVASHRPAMSMPPPPPSPQQQQQPPHIGLSRYAAGENPMERPLQAAIRATVTRPFANQPPPPMGFAAGRPAASQPLMAQGGNVFVDPVTGGSAVSSAATAAAAGRPVTRPAIASRFSASGNVNAHQTPAGTAAAAAAAAAAGAGAGTASRISHNYLRQPTFAPIAADHPKAVRYHKAESLASSSDNAGASSSGHPADRNAYQRDVLLREPADQPLAWRSAAQQVARVSRHAKGKPKTKSHRLLTEWLSSPSARLDKAQQQQQQQEAMQASRTSRARRKAATPPPPPASRRAASRSSRPSKVQAAHSVKGKAPAPRAKRSAKPSAAGAGRAHRGAKAPPKRPAKKAPAPAARKASVPHPQPTENFEPTYRLPQTASYR
eukprot:gene9270-6518_t